MKPSDMIIIDDPANQSDQLSQAIARAWFNRELPARITHGGKAIIITALSKDSEDKERA